jgi:hypothetical protein
MDGVWYGILFWKLTEDICFFFRKKVVQWIQMLLLFEILIEVIVLSMDMDVLGEETNMFVVVIEIIVIQLLAIISLIFTFYFYLLFLFYLQNFFFIKKQIMNIL